MSVLQANVRSTVGQLEQNMRDDLLQLSTKDRPEVTAEIISNWLASARLRVEQLGIINADKKLTPLGIAVIRALKDDVLIQVTTKQVLASSWFDSIVRDIFLAIDPTSEKHRFSLAELPEATQDDLYRCGVIDPDLLLTEFGRTLVADLKWHTKKDTAE